MGLLGGVCAQTWDEFGLSYGEGYGECFYGRVGGNELLGSECGHVEAWVIFVVFVHRLKSNNFFIYTNNDYIHYTLSILNSKVIFFK